MFRFVSEPTSANFTVDKSVRSLYVNNPGCSSSTIEQSLPPTTVVSSLERKEVLCSKHNFEQQLETGTSVVDKKFGDFQWDFSSRIGFTSCAPDGCFIDRLGCSSPGKINRRNMVISRKKMVYQRVGTTSSKASPPNISQESKLYFNSHTIGQYSGFDIFEKNGGNQESRIWEMLISKQTMITVEYLLSSLNKVEDLESRRKVDSSEWVPYRHVFHNLYLKLGTLTVDLFASRVSHQVAQQLRTQCQFLGNRVIVTHFPHFI